MAAAMQCDRCGAYFKPDTYKSNMVVIGKRSEAGNGAVEYTDIYDLCQDCIKQVKKFIGESDDKNEMET